MKRKTDMGIIDINSYKTSTIFGFIYEDFEIINVSLKDFLEKGNELAIKTESDILRKLEDLPVNDDILLQTENMSLEFKDICKNTLSDIFTKAALFYIYSKFENSILTICQRMEHAFYITGKIQDFIPNQRNRNALNKYLEFIKKYSQIDTNKLVYQDNVNDLKKIRDLLIHSDGRVIRKKEKIYFTSLPSKYNNELKFISESDYLLINDGFIVHISDILLKYIDNLLEEVWKNKSK